VSANDTAPIELPLLEGVGLRRRFGGVCALDGVDITIRAREVTGVIGPNGSGKTTLFDVLSGFTRPQGGSVRWAGHDVTRARPHERARLGLVRTFQHSMVFPGLTVEENLRHAANAARSRSLTPTDPDHLLEQTRLGHVGRALASDVSWGETRLLGIAMALVLRPSLLLLDEPFAGLSPAAAEAMGALLLGLRADGVGACIIDHEMSFLLPICQNLVVLVAGVKIAQGQPADVIERADVRAAYLGA
jgi:ABC-type branched-subunit amino acid transport system ATPase component